MDPVVATVTVVMIAPSPASFLQACEDHSTQDQTLLELRSQAGSALFCVSTHGAHKVLRCSPCQKSVSKSVACLHLRCVAGLLEGDVALSHCSSALLMPASQRQATNSYEVLSSQAGF